MKVAGTEPWFIEHPLPRSTAHEHPDQAARLHHPRNVPHGPVRHARRQVMEERLSTNHVDALAFKPESLNIHLDECALRHRELIVPQPEHGEGIVNTHGVDAWLRLEPRQVTTVSCAKIQDAQRVPTVQMERAATRLGRCDELTEQPPFVRSGMIPSSSPELLSKLEIFILLTRERVG